MTWQYVELDACGCRRGAGASICAAERAAVCDLDGQSAFRVALIRTAEDRHRFVLTNHHIVMDGWSLPILMREIFAGYYGQRLPSAASYRSFVTWLAGSGSRSRPHGVGRGVGRFRRPDFVGSSGPSGAGTARRCIVSGV